MRITHTIAAMGVAMALSGAVAVGTGGTAEAATPQPATPQQTAVQPAAEGTGTTVSMPVEPAACHRVWHPGAWYWWSHAGWDRRHPWLHRWERRQHAGWWDCR